MVIMQLLALGAELCAWQTRHGPFQESRKTSLPGLGSRHYNGFSAQRYLELGFISAPLCRERIEK